MKKSRLSGALALLLGAGLAQAAPRSTALLRPVPLSAACQQAGYSLMADPFGQPRVLRRESSIPDRAISQTQYYDARGRLLRLRASFSGYAGPMYDLTAQLDGQGHIVREAGFRSPRDRTDLRTIVMDLNGVQKGRCPI